MTTCLCALLLGFVFAVTVLLLPLSAPYIPRIQNNQTYDSPSICIYTVTTYTYTCLGDFLLGFVFAVTVLLLPLSAPYIRRIQINHTYDPPSIYDGHPFGWGNTCLFALVLCFCGNRLLAAAIVCTLHSRTLRHMYVYSAIKQLKVIDLHTPFFS